MLKMAMSVGASKMSSALVDALKPRCSDSAMIADFESCLIKGLPNGAPKGMTMAFETGGGKVNVVVDNKGVGSISSKPLAKVSRMIIPPASVSGSNG